MENFNWETEQSHSNNIDMKKLRLHSSAVLVAILLLAAVLVIKGVSNSYTETTVAKYKQMPKPVQLYWKEKNTFWYSVVLKDTNGHTERFGNLSKLANEIGENFNVGDTTVYSR